MKKNITLLTVGLLLGVSLIFVLGAARKEVNDFELVFGTVQPASSPDPIPVMWMFNDRTGRLWRYLETDDSFQLIPVVEPK